MSQIYIKHIQGMLFFVKHIKHAIEVQIKETGSTFKKRDVRNNINFSFYVMRRANQR